LTHSLARVRFDAQIFKHSSYCGSWAIDTAGSGKVPFHLIDRGSAFVASTDHIDEELRRYEDGTSFGQTP